MERQVTEKRKREREREEQSEFVTSHRYTAVSKAEPV